MPKMPAFSVPESLTMGDVLRIPIMQRLWIAQLVSSFGDSLALFAVISFLTFHLDATPHQVTNLQIAYMLPIAVLGVLAGVFVDRWALKPTMVGSDLIRAALCLLLLVAGRLEHFYLILAAISVLSSIFGPAQGVAIRAVVPMHGLRAAQAVMQQVLFGMQIIGPPLAVAIYKVMGPKWCYLADAATFVVSASLIGSITLGRGKSQTLSQRRAESAGDLEAKIEAATELEPEPSVVAPSRSALGAVLSDIREGLSFIVNHAGILFVIMALAAGMFILACFGPLIAVYVRDDLHASSGVYSVVSLMIGLGMFAGVNVLNTMGKRLSNTLLVYSGLLGIALGLVVLTLLSHVWSTMVGDLIIGVAVSAIVVPANTLIQQETPSDLMGRVGSSTMSLVFSAQILGLVLSGVLADQIGIRHVFAACASVLVLLVAAGKLWMEPGAVTEADSAS